MGPSGQLCYNYGVGVSHIRGFTDVGGQVLEPGSWRGGLGVQQGFRYGLFARPPFAGFEEMQLPVAFPDGGQPLNAPASRPNRAKRFATKALAESSRKTLNGSHSSG